MSHFGEAAFTAASCHRTCDICIRNEGKVLNERDMTQAAHDLLRVLLLPASMMVNLISAYPGESAHCV